MAAKCTTNAGTNAPASISATVADSSAMSTCNPRQR